jgi:UDP-N-acetyl-D-mannosaminuronic acid dehydrogenase
VDHDVAIIGCGRVGLPLALAFADHGLKVIGVDKAPTASLRSARPYAVRRAGAQEVTRPRRVLWTDELAQRPRARHIVITLGTRPRSPTSRST